MVAPPSNPFGYNVSDRTKLTSPAFGRAVMPSSSIGSYINQQLSGLVTGQSGRVGQAPAEAAQSMLDRQPQSSVALSGVAKSGQRVATDIAESNARVRRNLQIAKQRRQQRLQQSGGGVSSGARGTSAAGPTGRVGGTSGPAAGRIQSILKSFPGLRITEIGGNRDYDVAHGVARVPTSYHYDRNNPAVDIAGSTAQLDALYRELVRQGGWRQILWRVPGHYDHLHVA